MRNKLLFALSAIILLACGTGASATPYAVYCEGDRSLHLLDSDTELAVGETLASNSQEIT
ncbi:MAG: hypothetical protein K2K75_08210 [Muribaculaceae bacterium]|nr:hypothetical protein [Muribaculaceae bacterium]